MSLLDELVKKYAETDLATIFKEVNETDNLHVDLTKIDPEHYVHLKEVSLGQWLLESGRATSKLSQEATNFSGLKWRSEMAPFAEAILIKVPSEPTKVEFCQFANIDNFLRGYWKFLTRSPYKGLEENTFAPENFIGFIQSKGFAADINYISKVLSLVSEARELLATASGVVIPPPPDTLQVTSFPKEVEVREIFTVEGTASVADAGKKLSVLIDERFPGNDVEINQDGNWEFDFRFLQDGDRVMKISLGTQSQQINIKVSIPTIGAVKLDLSGSVGRGGINRKADIVAVKKRLHSLGFTWVGNPESSALNTGFIQAIKLFQSIIAGRERVGGDGRVDVDNTTHNWLQAVNAPGWRTMPDSDPNISLFNREKFETNDDHDFGTTWMADIILDIAKDYHETFRKANPGAALFGVNDVSRPKGGDTPDHSGHETGLMCDVQLPRKDGRLGTDIFQSNYDRNATRALIKSMRRQNLVNKVLSKN